MALCLSDSSSSFSSASFEHTGPSVAVHKLQCFISSGSTASAPYINWNGVKFVVVHTVVLWLHTAVGMTSAHLPFFSCSSTFLIASKIREFALSTMPLDCGWYTDECNLHSNVLAKIFEHCIVEVLCIVDCYMPGATIAVDNILPEEFRD
jgi:hypothetical protein